jgi:hypothetical protein
MPTLSIPAISNPELAKRAKTIRPVGKRDGKLYYYDSKSDHRNTSFSWTTLTTEEAIVKPHGLTLRTLHSFSYAGFFKPSVAEVIAQIPEEVRDEVVAFLVEGPDTVDDINREREARDAGFHVAKTTLYVVGKPKPQKPLPPPKPESTPFGKALLDDGIG